MQIIDYQDAPEKWNKFIIANSHPASFLQSFEWGEFNAQVLGKNIIKWAAVDDDNELQALALGIEKDLPAGKTFYYCPRGIIYNQKQEVASWAEIFGQILKKVWTQPRRSIFIRVSPPYEFVDYKDGFFQRLGFTRPKILAHLEEPKKISVLELSHSIDKLLQAMHPKTRYNIRLAEKKGVKIRRISHASGVQEKELKIFCELIQTTAKRDKIKAYSSTYYQNLFRYFSDTKKDMTITQYIAEYQGKALSSLMVVYFGDTATYLHGASSDELRNLMPNYLIQWQAIKDAQDQGFKHYDFGGISEDNPAWTGITRFKQGFGGKEIMYLGTWDLVIHYGWYTTFRLAKAIKELLT
jgi:peptidoglycan pentaglycine glycine transferase (the first glycine)